MGTFEKENEGPILEKEPDEDGIHGKWRKEFARDLMD